MRQFIRNHLRAFIILGGLLAGTAVLLSPAPTFASSNKGDCQEVSIPVALAAGQPKNKTIHGELCSPWSSTPDTVDVLSPGGTYDSLYWDFPFEDYKHSYVDRTLSAGRATFNFDHIGTGESSKPLSALVSLESDVYTMHQVVQWLRNEKNFGDVTMVGHSAGSIAALYQASKYKDDADRIVATGFMHSPGFKFLLVAAGGLYPAALDPQFIGKMLDVGYLTTTPGTRERSFYSSSADRKVIAYDDAHKGILSAVEAEGLIGEILLPAALNSSRNVTAPVLTVVGDQDPLCGPPLVGVDCNSSASVQNYEKPFFPQAKNYTAHVMPDTGHNLPLHPSADQSFNVINNWIKTH
jgi:pimeloyl-ACP methyl ester carboxylesterase